MPQAQPGDAPLTGALDAGTAPVPPDNQPGHHPEHEQDKPSGEAFVAKVRERAKEPAGDTGTAASSPSGMSSAMALTMSTATRAAAMTGGSLRLTGRLLQRIGKAVEMGGGALESMAGES